MTKRVSANVYMQLTVEVHVGSWEANASFEELYKQAQREASNSVRHVIRNTNIKLIDDNKGYMGVHIKESN